MAIRNQYMGGMAERLLVRIITSDPVSGTIEGVGKDRAALSISTGNGIAGVFRWPNVGELWVIERVNMYWTLKERIPDDTEPGINLSLGELRLDGNIVKLADGKTLATLEDLPNVAQAISNHNALKTGVHGIPSMGNGEGLLWNGTNWVATNLATQAELDTLDNRVDALEAISGGATGLALGGPWATVAPPNGTSGTVFSITKSRTYTLATSMTGYATTSGLKTGWTYIDGVQIAGSEFFFNQTGVHSTLPTHLTTVALTAGTHYFYLRFSDSSDAFDRCYFALI